MRTRTVRLVTPIAPILVIIGAAVAAITAQITLRWYVKN